MGRYSILMHQGEYMAQINKHGLGRTIPAQVRREVRQRCGFGCVICGLSLYDYEHFSPDFKDATFHDPKGITLLCMQCNQKRNRKVLSVETVAEANINPKCLQQGFANEAFDFGSHPIEVKFAGVTFKNVKHLIRVEGIPILSIKNPETKGAPFLLSGKFSDDCGLPTLTIEHNEWRVGGDTWDIECEGAKIIIRKAPGDIALVLRSEPPYKLVVERLNMEFEGIYFRGNEDLLEISNDGKYWDQWRGCSMEDCLVGMQFG